MFKDEATFQEKLLSHIRLRGGFGFKISDSDIRLKPADCIVTVNGDTVWLELKYKGLHSRPQILAHQESACKRVWNAGGKYFFIQYNCSDNSIKIIEGFVPDRVKLSGKDILKTLFLDDFL